MQRTIKASSKNTVTGTCRMATGNHGTVGDAHRTEKPGKESDTRKENPLPHSRISIKDSIMAVLPLFNSEEGKKFCLQKKHGKSGKLKDDLLNNAFHSEEISSAIGEIFGVDVDPRSVRSCLRTIIEWQSDKNGLGHNLACLGIYFPYGGWVEEPVRGFFHFRPFMNGNEVPALHKEMNFQRSADVTVTGYAIKDAVLFCLRNLRLNGSEDTYKVTAGHIAEMIMKMGVVPGKKTGAVEKTVKRLMKTLAELRNGEDKLYRAMVITPSGGTVECDSTAYNYAYERRHYCKVIDSPGNGKKRVSKGNGKSLSLKPNCRYYFSAES